MNYQEAVKVLIKMHPTPWRVEDERGASHVVDRKGKSVHMLSCINSDTKTVDLLHSIVILINSGALKL